MILAGFSSGRRNGNTEVLIKEALEAAREMGVEIKYYCLRDYDLHQCTPCRLGTCAASSVDINACPYKDDAIFLVNEFLNADGVILGSPVYSLTVNSLMMTFRDRIFGPKMDIATVAAGGKEMEFVKGRFRARAGGLISVGGAGTEHWTSLALPELYTTCFSAQTEVVDVLNAFRIADPGAATLREDLI